MQKKYRLIIYFICSLLFSLSTYKELNVKPSHGFNIGAYRYFSALYYEGVNPYNAPDTAIAVTSKFPRKKFIKADYLDYTGLQLSIYNLVYKNQLKKKNINWFVTLSFIYIISTFIIAFFLAKKSYIRELSYVALILFVLFLPGFKQRLFIISYEDKAVFLLIPLVCLYLFKEGKYYILSFLTAIFTGLVGIAGVIFPLILIQLVRGKDGFKILPIVFVLSLFALGIVISFIPFFSENLIGWERRALRESINPFWYSVWNLSPIYFSNLNKIVMGLLLGLTYLLNFKKIINIRQTIIICFSLAVFLSNNTVTPRIIPIIIVFLFLFETILLELIYIILAMIYLSVDRIYNLEYDKNNVPFLSFIVNYPLLIAYLMLFFEVVLKKRIITFQEKWLPIFSNKQKNNTGKKNKNQVIAN